MALASLHCLSAFTAFPTRNEKLKGLKNEHKSPLPFGIHRVPDQFAPLASRFGQTCLHCLSAFTAFPTLADRPGTRKPHHCLHCLSAFTAFPTHLDFFVPDQDEKVSIAFRHSPRSRLVRAPLALSDWAWRVSIAFRHSPRSRPSPEPL
ncbi:hypothetical protein SBV1_2840005 [Verrucomicrobia bacterium]|nr:hypothetical protein SBV1_2840005 [Verrucomicrobiota bacterium]